ncbi:MAG TPA: NlpC/P60 family protein [Actinoplanes sp.]|nr:NlpC/P60 family protein [Actinoplanes sp.]
MKWDSRECPGPSSEAALSRPSTRRVLTAGALALAVIAPALDPADHAAEAGSPPSVSQKTQASLIDPLVTLAPRRAARASRSAARRANTRPAVRAVRASAHRSVVRETAKISAVRRAERSRHQETVRVRITTVTRRDSARVAHRTRRNQAAPRPAGGMAAVIAYARSQVGKRYASGGEGPYSFDCSGFTKRAYARAGLSLRHSSGAQAARARIISRAEARPGDLVVGPGHVGIYMGGGMMIDAGNERTGVIYRPLYGGLHVERF